MVRCARSPTDSPMQKLSPQQNTTPQRSDADELVCEGEAIAAVGAPRPCVSPSLLAYNGASQWTRTLKQIALCRGVNSGIAGHDGIKVSRDSHLGPRSQVVLYYRV